MDFIDTNISFQPEMKYLCAKNCAYQILEYMGAASPLAYIYTGFIPYICVYKEEFLASGKPLNICGKNSYILQGKSHDFDEVLLLNRHQLEDGVLPILLVDTYFMPYRIEYGKNHGSHTVILSAVKDQSVEIIDWYDTVMFKGEIAIDDFKKARCSQCNDRSNPFALMPIANAWISIERNKVTQEMKDKIMFENISLIARDLEPQNKLEKVGINSLKFIQNTLLLKQQSTQMEKSIIMKKAHDALFPYLCTSKLMKKYIKQVFSIKDNHRLMIHLQTISDLLEKINYNSMRCAIMYRDIHYQKVQLYFSDLIKEYPNLQNEALQLQNTKFSVFSDRI